MTVTLDVSKLPFDQELELCKGRYIRMREYLDAWQPILRMMAANSVIKSNASFGFAMLPPLWDGQEDFFVDEWDDPYAFTWFAGGWGSDSNRYVANAVRKIRPLLRINDEVSTLSMVLGSGPTEFEDVVEQVNDNGDFEWGDFPYGGASVVRYGPLELVGACSGFKQVEDHLVTELILGHLAKRILAESDPPLP